MTGIVFDIKEFALHDGPGPRVTVFFKGCPLRCKWCHNPEGLSPKPQLMIKQHLCTHCGKCLKPCTHSECRPFNRCLYACSNDLISLSGKVYEVDTLLALVTKNADFYKANDGGITISGGEPLMQEDFLCSFLEKVNLHKAIQTSGYAPFQVFKKVVAICDYVMLDIKIANKEKHMKYTGVSNELILENFSYLKNSGKKYIIRTPLIPGITDTKENLEEIQSIIGDSPWEHLPYNSLAAAKYSMLGMEYGLNEL